MEYCLSDSMVDSPNSCLAKGSEALMSLHNTLMCLGCLKASAVACKVA